MNGRNSNSTTLPRIALCGWGLHGKSPTESFLLPDLWSLHLYQYHFTMLLDGRTEYQISPGDCTLIPPGCRMTFHYRAAENQHLFCLFKEQDLLDRKPGAQFFAPENQPPALAARFESMLRLHATNAPRAALRLLDIVWELQERGKTGVRGTDEGNPLVARCKALVRMRLAESPQVGAIAQRLQVSHNHLTRLFVKECGITVQDFINRERLQRARYLLGETRLPIKRIAQECGLRDAQHFNKFLRKHEGLSPRQFRARQSRR